MKASFKLIGKSFFFAGPLSLVKGAGPSDIELSNMDDAFLRCVAVSTSCGILKSSASIEQIVNHIKSDRYKLDTMVTLGLATPHSAGVFNDVVTVKPVIVKDPEPSSDDNAPINASVSENVHITNESFDSNLVTTEDADLETTSTQTSNDFSDIDVSDESLDRLLRGSNNAVIFKLEQASLSSQDKERLIALEKAGKNRRVILAIIEKLK